MAWSISNAMMRDYENSRCSQARGGASSEGTCLGAEQSALSSTTPMPDQYYWPDKTTEHSRLFRFGMTCAPLMESRGEDLLTWYRQVSHVQTYPQPAKEQELTAQPADSIPRWCGSFASYDQSASSWKTAQCSLVEGLDEFLEIWPRWGSMRNGVAYLAEVLVPTTSVTESGFRLPTPTCHNSKEGAYPAEYTRNTPTLATHVGGKIHPNFTEWMMGWPRDWTDLKPLETAKFREWSLQHGGF